MTKTSISKDAPAAGAIAPTPPKRRVAHTAKRNSKTGPELVVKDAERTRAEIIEVATKEFSQRGYSGGSHSTAVRTADPVVIKSTAPVTVTIGQSFQYTLTFPGDASGIKSAGGWAIIPPSQ